MSTVAFTHPLFGFTASGTANVPLSQIQMNAPVLYSAIIGGSQPNWDKGIIDVTKPPYNASTASADNSSSINQAVRDGFNNNFTVFIPSGTFAVQSPISCAFDAPSPLNGNLKYCNVLAGSASGGRSVLKYAGSGTATPLVYFAYTDSGTADATRQYGSTFQSIDIDMGNHASQDAISMVGAQNCDIEDMTISGTFRTGIVGIPGSGGSINGVTVLGGQVGIASNTYRPNPVLAGITLRNQSVCGLSISTARGPVCVIGFDISSTTTSSSYYAVSGNAAGISKVDPKGDINLIDGQISVGGTAGIGVMNFGGRSNIAMRNVYIKAPTLVQSGTAYQVAGSASVYQRISKYAFVSGTSQGSLLDIEPDNLSVNVIDQRGHTISIQDQDPIVTATPPSDLVSRHLWNRSYSWQDSALVDIRTYGATPDDASNDDAPAINSAISYAAAHGLTTVLIPRGQFHIQSPIALQAGVNLVGGGKNLSVLQMISGTAWNVSGTTSLLTVASGTQGCCLQNFALLSELPSASGTNTAAPNYLKHVTLLNVQNSDTVLRDVITTRYTNAASGNGGEVAAPVVTMGDAAGGKFYDLSLFFFSANANNGVVDNTGNYHLLQIQNTTHPIYLYSPSLEHVTISGAEMQLDHAQNVHVIGLKAETSHQVFAVNDSINCSVFGASGELSGDSTQPTIPIFQVSGSTSDRLWFSLLDRHVQDTYGNAWVTSGTFAVSGTLPMALFKQGASVILEPGLTETFSGSSNFGVLGSNYSYGTDANGYPCINYIGTNTAGLTCSQSMVDTTKGYEVSAKMKMDAIPANNWDTPTLIFEKSNAFSGYGTNAYSVRIKSNGSLLIQGPDLISQVEYPAGALLVGGTTTSSTNWNRVTVQVSGSTATFYVNGALATSVTSAGIALAQDPVVQGAGGAGPIVFGFTGRNGMSCAFENFWYYQLP